MHRCASRDDWCYDWIFHKKKAQFQHLLSQILPASSVGQPTHNYYTPLFNKPYLHRTTLCRIMSSRRPHKNIRNHPPTQPPQGEQLPNPQTNISCVKLISSQYASEHVDYTRRSLLAIATIESVPVFVMVYFGRLNQFGLDLKCVFSEGGGEGAYGIVFQMRRWRLLSKPPRTENRVGGCWELLQGPSWRRYSKMKCDFAEV